MTSQDMLLVHYHEIGLKGKNRPVFERALLRNLKRALGDTVESVRLISGRIEVVGPQSDAIDRAARVFGVANVAPVSVVPADTEKIIACGLEVARTAMIDSPFESFAVRSRRARTSLSTTSQEINIALGDVIRESLDKVVDLKNPDLTVRIEIVENRAYISARKVSGPGGLPVGTAGRVVALLSAGIDSPVAAWRLLKRGADVVPVHFHGRPFTDPSSEQKVSEIIEVLAGWGLRSPWWSVPIGEAQREITLVANPSLRILLYRRLMLRIAEKIAASDGALAVVTGESLGQVASQTLENLGAVGAVATLPLLRPLIGSDKLEIIDEAQRIGTFEISTRPHQDCCTLFEPRDPATRATTARLDAAELAYDTAAMADACLSGATRQRIGGGEFVSTR